MPLRWAGSTLLWGEREREGGGLPCSWAPMKRKESLGMRREGYVCDCSSVIFRLLAKTSSESHSFVKNKYLVFI